MPNFCKNSRRKNNLQEVRRWRKYRDAILKAETEEQLKEVITELLPGFRKLTISHGWMTDVAIYTTMGQYYSEAVLATPTIRAAALQVYWVWCRKHEYGLSDRFFRKAKVRSKTITIDKTTEP